MGEDILHKVSKKGNISTTRLSAHVDNSVLLLLQRELHELETCLENFGLPALSKDSIVDAEPQVIQDEIFDKCEQEIKSERNLLTFNCEQTLAYQMILEAVLDSECPMWLFFINAPGGYGKTFLIETVLSSIRCIGKIALAVALSGIAAELLEGRRTAHS